MLRPVFVLLAAEFFFCYGARSFLATATAVVLVQGEECGHARIPPVASFDGVMPSSGEWGYTIGRYKWVEIKE